MLVFEGLHYFFYIFFELLTNYVGLSNPLQEYVHPQGRADISRDIIL